MWNNVIGQHRVKEILKSALRANRLPHAYLFHGPEGVGKDAMALELACVLQCEKGELEACGQCASCARVRKLQHPDVKFVTALPVGKNEKADDPPLAKLSESEVVEIQAQYRLKAENPYYRVIIPRATIIKINSIRELRRETALTTLGRGRRVIVVSHADEMGAEASNTLLKTLEEPSGQSVIILTTSNPDSLLTTIRSRCQSVRFDPLTEDEIASALVERSDVTPANARMIARLSHGSYARAVELLSEDVAQQRSDAQAFVRHCLSNKANLFLDDIERLSAGKNRDLVVRFLTLLLVWFRDALVLSHGGTVINVDQQNDIASFLERMPSANLVQAIEEIERTISLVNRNVYISLALTNLAVRLRKCVRSPRMAEDC
jgi:DNA polymerase-3 subunit delta'